MGRHKIPVEIRRANDARNSREYYQRTREYQCARNRAYRESHKQQLYLTARRRLIKKRYGLEMDQAVYIWEIQNKSCAICHRAIESPAVISRGKKHASHVDHCHENLKIRGILCASCNLGIGLLGDKIEILKNAIAYLESH